MVAAPLHNRSVPATLRSLRIRNLALVETLDWELVSGFNVVTGETGAGKSIIIGALNLVLGERADKSLIRTGAEQCSVEARFELANPDSVNRVLTEQGVDECEGGQLLIKRLFSLSGSSRQFINGSQTTLSTLKEIGEGLVDLHGPHDHQSLLAREQQLFLVDAFAENLEQLPKYRKIFREVAELQNRKTEFLSQSSDENLELWRHQLDEIESAELRIGERAEIEARYKVSSNARRLLEISSGVLQLLAEIDASVMDRLKEIGRQLRELERLDDGASEFLRSHEVATVELEDLERSLVSYQSSVEIDPEALARMENRLNLLQSLERKYRHEEEGLLEMSNELRGRLERFDRREEVLLKIEGDIRSALERLGEIGLALSKSRDQAGAKLAKEIRGHLKDLGFKQAHFGIEFERVAEPRVDGFEVAEFLFAPNPGEPLKPLRAIASSGEISRVMLAIKTALARQDLVGLLVFDEIDANVGGEIAHSVGAKMRSLGESRQVLAITHMPQVAAVATRHFLVDKEVVDGRTRTVLREVSGANRIEELARMLGGKSKTALDHAKELLGSGIAA
jgi:DNA repair protein RecN (Recombination protein N)